MPQNRWPPRAHVVHVFVPVHIPDVRPFSFIDKKRLAAHRTLGELDSVAGRHADAAAHLDQALGLAEACAAPYERALTLLALALLPQ